MKSLTLFLCLGALANTASAQIVKPLGELNDSIEEIVVTSTSALKRVNETQIGVEKINIAELAKVPALFGEHDIMRSIQLLPGVKSEGDGSSGYQVRGGTAAQNQILLDNATIYNSGHLMGIFSAFNDEVLSNASLYKGLIPAQFGGATSSVFDISTKSGSTDRWHGGINIGLLATKINADGPIGKKLTLIFAARRSYLDLFLKGTDEYKDNTLYFYDINAKLNFRMDDKNNLSLSVYKCRDNMGLKDLADMSWGNIAVTGRWNHMFNEKLSLTSCAVYSSFNNDMAMHLSKQNYECGGHIRQALLKENLLWNPNDSHSLNIGVQGMWQQIKSGDWMFNFFHDKEVRSANNNDIWINDDWKVCDKLNISAGLRLDMYSPLGGSPYYDIDANGYIINTYNYKSSKFVKTYFNLEPRLSMKYNIDATSSLKLGYSRTTQSVHATRSSGMSMPYDRYTISTNNIKPEVADQISLGYIKATNNEAYDFSIEGYYKDVRNIYDYKDGKAEFLEMEIERIVLGGKGRAYGIEVCARKNLGKFTGWIAYTLSWSENKIDGINGNRWYTANNDRRHDLNIVAMYALNKQWNLSSTFTYNTGQALSAPSAKYDFDGDIHYYYEQRNGYRAPAYHRLDLSATYTKKLKHVEREWAFGVYNAYNRYNPYVIMFQNDEEKPSGTVCNQYSLFGVIPFVSFGLKF